MQSVYSAGTYGGMADLDPGSGTCSVTGSNYESYLSKFIQMPTGLTESTTYLNLEIAPNPSNGKIKINTSHIDNFDVIVYSAEGKQVFSQTALSNNKEVNLQNVSKGVYIIQLRDRENRTVHKRLIIE
jgi:hypothetical protein